MKIFAIRNFANCFGVLPSITNEVLKAVVAGFNAEELITNRYGVTKKITELLTERAKQFG